MIHAQPTDPSSEAIWRELDQKLRPFIARRLRAQTDVDDVVQNVFLKIQRSLPQLRDEQRFGPWVYQVTRSAIVDHLRARSRHPVVASEWVSDAPSPDERIDSDLEREVADYATHIIAKLPSPYREALTLTDVEGMTQKAAAAQLGISVSGMKSRVQRGREKLRAALEACCHIALDARHKVIGCEPRSDRETARGCCK